MGEVWRNDTQETATAGERWFFGMAQSVNDSARAVGAPLGYSSARLEDAARLGERIMPASVAVLSDSASAGSSVRAAVRGGVVLHDGKRRRDRLGRFDSALLRETARIRAGVFDRHGSADTDYLSDWARLRDAVFPRVSAGSILHDGYALSGSLKALYVQTADERVRASDISVLGRGVVLDDAAAAQSTVSAARQAVLADSCRVSDWVGTRADAFSVLRDDGMVSDTLHLDGLERIAYRVDLDGWCVSRWGVRADDLAAVDNGLWLLDDGVSVPDAGIRVSGSLDFGLVDVSGGVLAHPVSAVLEYRRDADTELSLTVSELQSGIMRPYRYRLAAETADALTNGRFVLGRGLRGRHFALRLDLDGSGAYINDFKIDIVPTRRRV